MWLAAPTHRSPGAFSMAEHSWNGSLRLSLISCPVRLSVSTEDNELTTEEGKAFEAMTSKIIDLDHFVSRAEVDPLYLRTSYFVQPEGELAAESRSEERRVGKE